MGAQKKLRREAAESGTCHCAVPGSLRRRREEVTWTEGAAGKQVHSPEPWREGLGSWRPRRALLSRRGA